jgi:hypothetical protein
MKSFARIHIIFAVFLIVAMGIWMVLLTWLGRLHELEGPEHVLFYRWQLRIEAIGFSLKYGTTIPWLLFGIYHGVVVIRKKISTGEQPLSWRIIARGIGTGLPGAIRLVTVNWMKVTTVWRAFPELFMIKAFLFALLFIIAGLVIFALVAPLLFHGADPRKLGAAAFPIILVVCGGFGFVFGLRRSKKQ